VKKHFTDIDRAKFLIKYSLNKTLSENIKNGKKIISETPYTGPGISTSTTSSAPPEKEYPEYCKYKDKAVQMPVHCGALRGQDKQTIKDFCNYQTPAIMAEEKKRVVTLAGTSYNQLITEPADKINGIILPKDSNVIFWTQESIMRLLDGHFNKHPNSYTKESDKKELIDTIFSITPIGTVQAFNVMGVDYHSTYTNDNGIWKFAGYKNDNNTYYESPKCVDVRTSYQKFVDDWGFALQIAAALGTALLGGLTGGAAWVFYLELATEMGLGTMTGLREIEKGENVSAALSFITGVLPFAKFSKYFRGVSKADFTSLSEKLKNSRLTSTSSETELMDFYNTLNEGEQKVMTQLLSQDDIARAEIINLTKKTATDDLPKIILNDIKALLKTNPDAFKDLALFEKLWARELSWNGIVIILGIGTNMAFGRNLNSVEEKKLQNVYFNIPASLQKEVAYNLIYNSDKLPEIIKTKGFAEVEKGINYKKTGENWAQWYNTKIKDSVSQAGGTYIELSDNETKSLDKQNNKKVDKVSLRKNGWVPENEVKPEDDYLTGEYYNGEYWIKIK